MLGESVHGDFGGLPQPDLADIRLVHVGDDFHAVQSGDLDQSGSGQAGSDRLALLLCEADDRAGDGGSDVTLVVLRFLIGDLRLRLLHRLVSGLHVLLLDLVLGHIAQGGLLTGNGTAHVGVCAIDLRARCRHIVFCGLDRQIRLPHAFFRVSQISHRGLHVFGAHDAGVATRLGGFEAGFGLIDGIARGLHLCPRLRSGSVQTVLRRFRDLHRVVAVGDRGINVGLRDIALLQQVLLALEVRRGERSVGLRLFQRGHGVGHEGVTALFCLRHIRLGRAQGGFRPCHVAVSLGVLLAAGGLCRAQLGLGRPLSRVRADDR